MRFKLKTDGKVKYSKGEINAFSALGSKPRSSTDIMSKVYPKTGPAYILPYNGRKIVIGVLASLKRKMLVNREPFKLLSTERAGPHPIEFWLEASKK